MNGRDNGHANGHANGTDSSIDVVIIGAGISGINAAYRLQTECPNYSYTILEARDDLGGTWDLFRYPGIRSDSDLYTFGFRFNPWTPKNPIAEGHMIKGYMRETAEKFGIDKHMRFRHRLISADWFSTENLWTLNIENDSHTKIVKARFILFGSGYYNYKEPLEAKIPGLENFQGQVIHPQFWPEDLDYKKKKILIIGSGATAITLLPNLAAQAERVTMIQRSPTYVFSLPNNGNTLLLWWLVPFSWLLPKTLFKSIQRMAWLLAARFLFLFCRSFPSLSRWILKLRAKRQLPSHIPHDPHFKPRYGPWEQRLCVSPDGDFYKSLRSGKADVRTDTIKTVTKKGITINSGETLDADIIITATGLKLQIAGGAVLSVDGKKIDIGSKYMWNGIMIQDLPNAAFFIGYTNASWTLGADATAQFVTRLLNSFESRKLIAATPRMNSQYAGEVQNRPLLNLSSTYINVADRVLPMAADRGPWQARDHYRKDIKFSLYGKIDDQMEYVHGSDLHVQPKIA
ncbi:uncharacterized protein N7483_006237 [Penicillium malachiteum]|uniref:uncharacterized protein n=1 Tax=Penicillium malachiteum TaxID=1324776 RepID=UPI0025491232|nr:uncharacterized protein N7483_006237 [Penicillium malachiteum]KAJ5731729.1 hypothetical protein N7483_006237 [Penicillium malachiteum]